MTETQEKPGAARTAMGTDPEVSPKPPSSNELPRPEGSDPNQERLELIWSPSDPAPSSPMAARSPKEEVVDNTRWSPEDAIRTAAHQELAPELLRQAVQRLRGIALTSGIVLLVYVGAVLGLVPHESAPVTTVAELAGSGAVASVVMVAITRIRSLRPEYALDLGYVYLFTLCLLLGLIRHSEPWPASEPFRQWSLVTVPILAFGALIPATPRKALALSLSAAAMDPFAFYVMRSARGMPPTHEVALLLASPFLGGFIAYAGSRVIHQLSEGIVKARQVGSYRLVEQLGVGGMAEVWRANHRMLARPAAIKLIRPQILLQHGPQDAERLIRLFAREARTTASLCSPHTIQLFDFGITREGAFYHVMELLQGIDLQTLVVRFGPQPPERVADLLGQACHSLFEAHQRNFVHRDVKPANIFICHYGTDFDFVKVLDFGLVLDRHPTAEELEDEKRFVGTPAVMAPEMVRFHAPVDARADLYALGCVGYWLLTGKRVFEASTRHDMLVMHAHQKPLTPSKRLGTPIHEGLEAVLMTCLDKNPNRRPQTARELKERLEALTFNHPWSQERAELWWKRNQPTQTAAKEEPQPAKEEPAAAPAPASAQPEENN